jgi:hypothetical protein
MFTVVASVLLAGAVPAGALAHHHTRGHHKAKTHRTHFRRFGDVNSQPTSTAASDNAGTVQSFSNGVLTIALNDGSTVTGAVTGDTELECTSTQQSSTTTHDDGDPGSGGDGQTSGDNSQSSGDSSQSSGDSSQSSGDSSQSSSEDQGDDQSDQGDDQGDSQSSSCSTSSLTPGAVVHEASLRIGGSGATWQKVELVS